MGQVILVLLTVVRVAAGANGRRSEGIRGGEILDLGFALEVCPNKGLRHPRCPDRTKIMCSVVQQLVLAWETNWSSQVLVHRIIDFHF